MIRKKLKVDISLKCVEIEKHYGLDHVWNAFRYGKKHPKARKLASSVLCCYEPMAMFRTERGDASLPYLGFRFEVGKRYRIRAEEI